MDFQAPRSVLGLLVAGSFLAVPLSAQDPYQQPDDSWISVDSPVADVMEDAFTLDYGSGLMTVEIDDDDRDAEAYTLDRGDKVSVTGVIDDEFTVDTGMREIAVELEELGGRWIRPDSWSPRSEGTQRSQTEFGRKLRSAGAVAWALCGGEARQYPLASPCDPDWSTSFVATFSELMLAQVTRRFRRSPRPGSVRSSSTALPLRLRDR